MAESSQAPLLASSKASFSRNPYFIVMAAAGAKKMQYGIARLTALRIHFH